MGALWGTAGASLGRFGAGSWSGAFGAGGRLEEGAEGLKKLAIDFCPAIKGFGF